MIEKFITNIETKSFNDDERSFVAWASRASIDRDDEEIDANGWELKNFKNNPVIPLFHDYYQFPVAKALWIKPEPKENPTGLLFKPQFAGTELGMEAYYLYKNGFMNAFSVGFDPIEWQVDNETFNKQKDGDFSIWQKLMVEQKKRKPRCKFIKQELLEISGVVVPAHPDALVEARAFIKNPLLKNYFDNIEKKDNSDILTKAMELQAIMKERELNSKSIIIDPFTIKIDDKETEEYDQSSYDGNIELDIEINEDIDLELIEVEL